MTVTLDRVIRHTVVHHSSTSTYIPNFIGIGKTFCGRTNVRTDGHLTHVIRSTLRSRPNNFTDNAQSNGNIRLLTCIKLWLWLLKSFGKLRPPSFSASLLFLYNVLVHRALTLLLLLRLYSLLCWIIISIHL